MSDITILQENGCGCINDQETVVSAACCECELKMELTFEEQGILDRLRQIKGVARSVISVIKELEQKRFDSDESGGISIEEEWFRLSQELEGLRASWSDLSRRLDEATERKWIMLGHRQPRA
jgi:hypothetical protein